MTKCFRPVLLTALLLLPLRAGALTLAVQAGGELPGFRVEDAAPWLAARMADARITDWQFVPRDAAMAAPDRVEWRFERLPYAGGSVRQFFPMPGVGPRQLIAAEARLYLDGQYQTVTLGQEAVQGGAGDPLLAAFIVKATQNLAGAFHAIDMTAPRRAEP